MFDLAGILRQWRQEIETTLAFSSEEIDELEDHLRFSFEAKVKAGLAPEKAWTYALGRLGSASALALEFAKDKLLPALGRLLVSWWKPAFLLLLFGFTFAWSFEVEWQRLIFWGAAWLSVPATLLLLPDKAQKNAVLAGIGNAFCLIPLLHAACYNRLTESVVGPGWSRMAASFGWLPLSLSVIGLCLLNGWWWKWNRTSRAKFPALSAVAGAIVLVLALAPFCSELIGHLSLRELYHLPTARQITLTGDAWNKFMSVGFTEVLINAIIYIQTMLPLVLAAVASMGIVAIQSVARAWKMKEPKDAKIFPTTPDLPWIMTMISGGICWVIASQVEPSYSEKIREAERSMANASTSHGGLEIVVLCAAIPFLIAGYELARRLRRSTRIRPFYASLMVGAELAVGFGVTLFQPIWNTVFGKLPNNHSATAEPLWLTWILGLTIVLIAFPQALAIRRRTDRGACATSIWQFDGKDLVQFGLLLGLITACSGMILMMVALDMAFVSVIDIVALQAWGTSMAKSSPVHFNPQDYGIGHLSFWKFVGIGYVAFCLAVGLGAAIILSGLEFIRFNCFRLYKIRKMRQGPAQTLAVNE